jgi:translation initiation factor IF-2
MRVYEFAKKHGLQSKELIALLSKNGFSVSSHMAVLSGAALDFLKNKFEKKIVPQLDKTTEKKLDSVSPAAPIQEKPAAQKKVKPATTKEEKKVSNAVPSQQNTKQATVVHAPYDEGSARDVAREVVSVAMPISVPLAPAVLSDFAVLIGKTSGELILLLLKWKILSNKNQLLTEDLIAKIAQHYGIATVAPVEKTVELGVREQRQGTEGERFVERSPVVVVMGHVDHGKTTLLDFIRKTRVAAREKGGITQHLGAYEAKTGQGDLVFIDTPGHEAFSKIRVRGAHVADIVILVVAADDGVMPQTIEALKHAQAMKAPIVVAINKIDRVEKARIDIVKRDLATQHGLMPEEWGGQTLYLPISAKTGLGVDKLLEMIVLQAQMMELKAPIDRYAAGFVLESKLEKGRGAVATVLTQQGTLRVGDYFVAGNATGRVSSLVDSFGQRISQAGPSRPVQVAGFNELADAGDSFEVVNKDTYLKTKQLFEGSRQQTSSSRTAQEENAIRILIKTDTNSSKEALVEAIAKISKKSEKGFLVLQSSIGSVSESDVMLAHDTGARIITLHVKAEPNANALAQRSGVAINSFDIIYKLLEYLQELSVSMAPVKLVRTKIGEAIVRKVFDIKNLGVIAGSYLKQGIFTRDGSVVIWRGNKKVGEGKIISLQRDKNAVKEVHTGYECAFMVENFKDWQVDDRVECFVERPEAAKK